MAGKRYDESVDVYSFGVVVLEVVERDYPFQERRKKRKKKGRGLDMEMLQEIAKGILRVEASSKHMSKWNPKILSLFRKCGESRSGAKRKKRNGSHLHLLFTDHRIRSQI